MIKIHVDVTRNILRCQGLLGNSQTHTYACTHTNTYKNVLDIQVNAGMIKIHVVVTRKKLRCQGGLLDSSDKHTHTDAHTYKHNTKFAGYPN